MARARLAHSSQETQGQTDAGAHAPRQCAEVESAQRRRACVRASEGDEKGHPAGTKTGDVIHVFRSGSIQLLKDVSIDPAGDVWAANNWNLPKAAMASTPDPRFSTWGGGSGLTIIYGVAAPVKPPRMGVVKGY